MDGMAVFIVFVAHIGVVVVVEDNLLDECGSCWFAVLTQGALALWHGIHESWSDSDTHLIWLRDQLYSDSVIPQQHRIQFSPFSYGTSHKQYRRVSAETPRSGGTMSRIAGGENSYRKRPCAHRTSPYVADTSHIPSGYYFDALVFARQRKRLVL